ncbi:hypothetical protein [Phyllobacterium myrsinacearum]|uniref:Uncharacterized protein n=1 Tax=Phyllobacterium myrsinacearum TaxID=28101 RepID=A0A2S9JJ90_9HYPH|nr:hypothetical protein [Phyllobacterium myrsinacearum]PRD53035.1 hypothetical protein C5750_11520 [Phyllobacterium myrsinacearum]PWV94127.1 MgsA-like AAA+ ATPase family protein [Phyllobacterium myrsinacearum]RZV07434.1 MgsA-like AAA+ ATPase family protein [Phyllobacterium myrsinacearum]
MSQNVNHPHPEEAELFFSSPTNTICLIDPWVASSLLHKAIRRGETDIAVAAALRLFQLRGAAIWRRFLIIAFEDIGPASPDTLILVSKASDRDWRRSHGDDVTVLVDVVRALAVAPKDRSPDYLVCAARHHPAFEKDRCYVGGQTLEKRIGMSSDMRLPLVTRAIATWYASGLDCSDERRVGTGDLKNLLESFATHGAPEQCLSATMIACGKTHDPICIMTPALWMAAFATENPEAPYIIEDAPLHSAEAAGIPLYTFDKHTRIGKAAIGRFAVENEDVSRVLSCWVADYRAQDAAAMAAYYVDAIPTTPQFTWHGCKDLEVLGRESDFAKIGFPLAGIDELINAVARNLEHLNELRAELTLRRTRKVR